RERGVFPAFEGSIYDKPGEIRPRNGARTTIAPTGTTAMLADCSSGCEPIFALTFAKNTIEGKRLFQTSPYFMQALDKRGLLSDELLEKIQANNGSAQGLEEIPDDMQRVFVVAGDITPEWHVRMQAAFQKYTDNAISKTINFPNSATIQDVRDAYLLVHDTGCKGITIYRDGSRDKQVLETKKENSYYDQLKGSQFGTSKADAEATEAAGTATGQADETTVELATTAGLVLAEPAVEMRPRPMVLNGHTYKVATPVGTAFVSINEDAGGNIFEVFVNVGRAGSDITADAEAIGRLISLAFRIPTPYSSDRIAGSVVEQLTGIGGSGSAGFGPQRVRSLADAIAKAIRDHEAVKAARGSDVSGGASPAGERTSAGSMTAPASSTSLAGAGETSASDSPAMSESARPAMMAMSSTKTEVDLCPDCGNASLRRIEGCQKCELCGFSKC
ncbi:MAG TPA: hypothetical protein VLF67_04985, partial [Candidatus Saccharimonas sp.]|nr:hypothetical protein [Candidatus Saccharimonas sp.]